MGVRTGPSLECSSISQRGRELKSLWSSLTDPLFLTNEELAALPVVRVPPSGKYTGTRLQATIRTLQGLLDQGIPSKELEVSDPCVYLNGKCPQG